MSTTSNSNGSTRYHEIKEIRVNLVEEQWGFVDRLLLWPQLKWGDCFDLKTGRYEVEPAQKNIQLHAYLSGVFDAIPWLEGLTGHIIQPHFNKASSWDFSRAEDHNRLKDQTMGIIVNAKLNAGKVYHPGWEQCRFCGNKGTCEALRQFAYQIVPAYAADHPEFVVPEPIRPSEITDDEVLNRILMFAKVMEKWCDSVKHHVTQLAREGHDFRNFRLIEISGVREIIRPYRAWELAQEKGITLTEYLNCCEVGMGKLDDLIMDKAPKGQKKRAAQEFSIRLQDEMAMDHKAPTFQMRARAVALENKPQ